MVGFLKWIFWWFMRYFFLVPLGLIPILGPFIAVAIDEKFRSPRKPGWKGTLAEWFR